MPVKAGYVRDEDLNFEAVVLLDEESRDSIEVQRSLEFDDRDVAQGMDTYCILRTGAASHYGGVKAFSHDARSVTFEFTGEAAEVLELPTLVTIEVDPDQLRSVLPVLERLLG